MTPPAFAATDGMYTLHSVRVMTASIVTEHSPIGLTLIHWHSGLIVFINRAGADIFGLTIGEAVGRKAADFFPRRRDFAMLRRQLIRTGCGEAAEVPLNGGSGNKVPFAVFAKAHNPTLILAAVVPSPPAIRVHSRSTGHSPAVWMSSEPHAEHPDTEGGLGRFLRHIQWPPWSAIGK